MIARIYLHQILVQFRLLNCWIVVKTSLFLDAEINLRRFLIQTNTKSFQFMFDDSFVAKRLQNIETEEDQMTCSCDSNDLIDIL